MSSCDDKDPPKPKPKPTYDPHACQEEKTKKSPCDPSPRPPDPCAPQKTPESKFPASLIENLKKTLKNIEYRKLLQDCFCKINTWILENWDPKKMADKGSGPAGSPRAMKFPYTFSAKIAQFPIGHYVKNQWIWKYYVISVAACVPLFYSIHKLSNSPGNVAKWAEIRRKEAAEHHH